MFGVMTSDMERLRRTVPQVGRIEWLGISPERRATISPVDTVEAEQNTGLAGDHHASGGAGNKRQVTLIQAEHLPVVASLIGRAELDPAELRRNVVISGINLWGLRSLRFQLGDVVLEGTGPCPPCSRMEENLGAGGYHAMRGHGGITAIVVEPGTLRVGDEVRLVATDDTNSETDAS